MSKSKYAAKSQFTVSNVMYWTVGALLVLTLLSTWLVCGMYAKYIVSDDRYDSARVAMTGIKELELWEHEAEETYENSGLYELIEDDRHEVRGNTYKKVLPGVDIPKDPFIRLVLDMPEVSYELYIRVTESNPFPEYVTYKVRDDLWEKVSGPAGSSQGIYKYKDIFEAKTLYTCTGDDVIEILEDNTMYVSEHYVGNGQTFTLTFEAWLEQARAVDQEETD